MIGATEYDTGFRSATNVYCIRERADFVDCEYIIF